MLILIMAILGFTRVRGCSDPSGVFASSRSEVYLNRFYLGRALGVDNRLYQAITNISKPGASLNLQNLVSKGLINKGGTTGRGTHYILDRKG